ncbi:MAG: biotin--[acetyl-CoA-carboxylase] ligase [Thermoguttaceae bacterium]
MSENFESPFSESEIFAYTPIKKIEHHKIIGSTNDRAKELALTEKYSLPALVTAESQTAGRGRGAKKWWTGSGAIAMSLALDLATFGKDRSVLPVLSPLIAEKVRDTICLWLEKNGLTKNVEVHFPNDVYIDRKKVCGILIESPTPDCAVIGIGINTNNTLVHVPDELKAVPITTLFDETGLRVDTTEFMVELLARLFNDVSAK